MAQCSIPFRWSRWLLALLAAAGLAGCSTVPSAGSAASTDMAAPMPNALPAPAPQVAAEARERRAPSASAAPSMGTQWGEGRTSVVRTVEAPRLSPEHPQSLAQLRYADEASIRRALGSQADRQLSVLLAGGQVEWAVHDGYGRPLPIYSRRGGSDYQVAGRQGERYVLVFTNRSRRHYEVVATVDGLDVLSGQPGSLRREGYLLRAGETLGIEGFRTSNRAVATFRFATPDRAYAANTPAGDARNIGVIGAALFEVQLAARDAAAPPLNPSAGVPAPNPFPGDADRNYAPPPQYR